MKVTFLFILIPGLLLSGLGLDHRIQAQEKLLAQEKDQVKNLEQTTVRFKSDAPVPIFRIEEMTVENSGIHLTSDITIIERKMKMMTISPSVVTLPNGNVLLNVGGENEFNRTIGLNLTGKPVTVTISGSKEATMVWSAITLSGLLAFTLSLHNVDDSANFNTTAGGVKLTLPFVFAAATLAGAAGVWWNYPRVDVQ